MRGFFAAVALTVVVATGSASPIQQPEQTLELNYAFIGLVSRPGSYEWRENLTVREAIARAGGRAKGADPVAVFFRIPPDRTQVVARLDDLVRPRDILFIPPSEPSR